MGQPLLFMSWWAQWEGIRIMNINTYNNLPVHEAVCKVHTNRVKAE